MSYLDADPVGEAQYVSQYANAELGLVIHRNGAVADPDANDVSVSIATLADPPVVIAEDLPTVRESQGTYMVALASEHTAAPGRYQVRWDYALDGVAQHFIGILEVGAANPFYDDLNVGFKGIVDSVWGRFADLFDSDFGGPHLQVYWQTRFGRGRLAQLLRIAIGKLNSTAQPHMSYTLDGVGGAQFPFDKWGPLLEQALYIETLRHLRRSYTEQPSAEMVTVARLDRRDYAQRWAEILRDEEPDFKGQMDVFKIAHMGLGRPRVLVSGGVFGSYGPTRMAGSAAARPRYWSRFN